VVDNIPCPLGYPCLGRLCSGAMTAEGCYAPWTLSHGCSINYLIKFGSNTTPFWLSGSIARGHFAIRSHHYHGLKCWTSQRWKLLCWKSAVADVLMSRAVLVFGAGA